MFNKTETSLRSYLGRFALDYNKQMGEHDIRAFGFTEIRYADRIINPFQGYGIQYDRGNQVFTNPLIFDKLTNEGNTYFSLNRTLRKRGDPIRQRYLRICRANTFSMAYSTMKGLILAGKYSRSRWLPTWNIGAKVEHGSREVHEKISLPFPRLVLRASYGLTAKMNEQADKLHQLCSSI